ncbi:MAG: hypothetical protein M1818_003468 [Claussenomyces sp. TS43310]|nr:MAG: hypothetical protein M1818_003468 [Claussenomyces sp. TS43310]
MGIFTENGSSGFMGDCFFEGGAYGLYGGNQQYTVRGFEFSSQNVASICLIWDWGWTWSRLVIDSSPIGIKLINPADTTGQQAGSIYVLDSEFSNVATAISANQPKATVLESNVITLDNIGVIDVTTMVAFSDGTSLNLAPEDVDFVVVGNVEVNGSDYGVYNVDVQLPPSVLTAGSSATYYRETYFSKSRPQYEDISVDNIINVKDYGAMGDGSTDDTSAIGNALEMATTDNLIYFPAGSYIVTSTLQIQPGARITGEVWSQLVASGDYFADMTNPQVMLQVGAHGMVGTVEISDMLFTSIGALPGLILVEWNMAAESPGSVGLWDSHFRVGGAMGTKLQVADCPLGAAIQSGCIAATMMMHVTNGSSGYFENMWAWVADHDLDDAKNTQITVAVARGILIESGGPTWLLGTASEHSILYQYNFYTSTNTFAGMIQTESPYFQYTTIAESPGPFNLSVGLFDNDPVFPDGTCTANGLLCNFSWAVVIESTTNLTIAGAGLYSWYDNYDQTVCVDAQNCQQRLVNNQGGNDALYIWNIVTIGAVEMLSDTATGTIIYAANNTQAIAHPFWSILGAYLDDYATEPSTCDDDDESVSCQTVPVCDTTLNFDTLADLSAASGSFPDICTDYYALGVLGSMLDSAMANYSVANAGYDSVFGDYVTYTKEMVTSALTAFMAPSTESQPNGGPGNQYFKCEFKQTLGGDSDPITYNPCPIPHNQIDYVDRYTMTYTLENATGFWDELSSTYGISQSWVVLGNKTYNPPCSVGGDDGGNNLDKRDCVDEISVGIPLPSNNITVSNPKDIINNALPTIGALQTTILCRQMDLATASWYGPTDDILQVISMPVFMIVQAVNDMAEVKAVGEQEEKEKKIALILEILGIVFAFIPFLDDITPEIDILDGVLEIVSTGGNAALAIQGIIADPESAPMEILSALTGGGTREEGDYASMAVTRRGIDTEDLTKIGTSFQSIDADFQNIIKLDCLP